MHKIRLIITVNLIIYYEILICSCNINTKTIGENFYDYEDDKNSMIAKTASDDVLLYDDFYEEFDNWMAVESSMNIIFFGSPLSFLRLDSESILHILSHTKKHLIPISKTLLAWDIVTDGKSASFLQGREYLAFGSLLNVVPEEDLYHVNLADPSVLRFFADYAFHLESRKYGILVASYKRYFGTDWYQNGTFINDLGYMLCAFPAEQLSNIAPEVFREINVETLNKLERCSNKQLQVLYNIATSEGAYGTFYSWSAHEIGRLGMLFTFIKEKHINSLPLECISAITPEVMKALDQSKLHFFTSQQILRMNSKTRRIYILRMHLKNSLDMTQLVKKGASGRTGTRIKGSMRAVLIVLLMVTLLKTLNA